MESSKVLSARMRDWLLERTQIASGSHAGAVVGWLGDGMRPDYAYPEITGYYLSWLGFLETATKPSRGRYAPSRDDALTWLNGQLTETSGFPTRVYFDGGHRVDADWRNWASFCFDAGMIYRGVSSIPSAQRSAAAAELEKRTADVLFSFVGRDGSWISCLPHGGREMPRRWSTEPGEHLVKVAGGVLAVAGEEGAVDQRLLAPAEATLARYLGTLANAPVTLTHPRLYALEGLLQSLTGGFLNVRRELLEAYRAVAAHALDGRLLEDCSTSQSPVRSDVIAQLLRVGCVLVSRGDLDTDHCPQLARLAAAVARFVDGSGGVRFTETEPDTVKQLNVWCTMFGHQALEFHSRIEQGLAIPDEWVRVLV